MSAARRDIIGWPNVPVEGKGVWITERAKAHVRNEDCAWLGRERRLIYPVSGRPADWRELRELLVSRVRELVPAARLVRYKGGVAQLETESSSIEAYVAGYNAEWRLKGL